MTHLGRPESYKVEKVNSDPEQYRARPSNFFMQQRRFVRKIGIDAEGRAWFCTGALLAR
jgi:hypothetical protein